MKEAIDQIGSGNEEDDGYESEVDQDQNLSSFKAKFRKRLTRSAKIRKSHQDIAKPFRRIDSLARLLEGNSICAAVYYHVSTNMLWLANNKIHGNSRDDNEQINNMTSVFKLVSEEDISIETIIERLSKVIKLNFKQEKRFEIAKLKNAGIKITAYIREMLLDMFQCNLSTKEWKESVVKNLECDENLKYPYVELLKKISKLSRDFLKLRDFLLKKDNNDPLARGLLSAIRGNRFKILHVENKDVHAEMRILADTLASNPASEPYIGISKLCCDHCSLAMDTFGAKSRGVHGQSTKWQVPFFISSTPSNLKKFLGSSSYEFYQKMTEEKKKEALKYVASKDGNPIKENARHGRHMNADSSDSDVDFGPNLSDEEQVDRASELDLANVWQLRYITTYYEDEFKRLREMGLSIDDIIRLYQENSEKFDCLASNETYDFIHKIKCRELDGDIKDFFDKLSRIYDKDTTLFNEIVSDESNAIAEFGLEEVRDRYYAITQDQPQYDSDGEAINFYGMVVNELEKENGPDSPSESDESQRGCSDDEERSVCELTLSRGESDIESNISDEDESAEQSAESDYASEGSNRRFGKR